MEVRVPDIGDFSDVPVIEVLVGPGDEVAEEDPLVTLESDKATMEGPSPAAGKGGAGGGAPPRRGRGGGERGRGGRHGVGGLAAALAGDLRLVRRRGAGAAGR